MIRTLYVIHHSHTDVGYTNGQSRIIRWHGEFIRQAMEIAQRRDDFRWTCETFYPVEQFWSRASAIEKEQFLSLARAGKVGLSGTFLNYTELPDAPLLESLALRPRTFADAHGLSLCGAMTADINGTSLTHGRALAAAGVGLLVTFIHPHHGYVPLGKRTALYDWELGDGRSIMVLHTDQYHVGNEIGLCPGGENAYMWDWGSPIAPFDDGELERRLPRYLRRIQEDGWPYDWFVCAVSGLITDNGPPSERIAERIARWNAAHSGEIRIEMVTLDQLAQVARASVRPIYRGDCPDWWADGAAGDPEAVALFRQAQRQRQFLVNLARHKPAALVDLTALDTSLALFAEHTFGHAQSVRHPSNLTAHQLRTKKIGYAADAADTAEMLTDIAVQAIGCGPLHAERPLVFRAINVGDHRVCDLVSLVPDWYDAVRWGLRNAPDGGRIVKVSNGEMLPHQLISTHRGMEWVTEIALLPGETVDLRIEPVPAPPGPPPLSPTPPVPDQMRDLAGNSQDVPLSAIRTSFTSIDFTSPAGITRWSDARIGTSLIDPSMGVAPFSIVASRLPVALDGNAQCDARRRLGRNRNGNDAVWSTSRMKKVRCSSDGPHVQAVELEYELAGCELLLLRLWARHTSPRVDVEIIMHKTGTWDAENLYLALPFTAGDGERFYVDRGAGPMQPGIDQLPGTLIDFLGVQEGMAWCSEKAGIAIAQRDSHLVQLGPLGYEPRKLADGLTPLAAPTRAYIWLMTNYWETNFTPELGGFYSFRFSVTWGEELRDAAAAIRAARDMNAGLHAFRLGARAQ